MNILRKLTAAAAALVLCVSAVPIRTFSAVSVELPSHSAESFSTAPKFSSLADAGEYFRSQMRERNTQIIFIIPRKLSQSLASTVNTIMEYALMETDSPEDGDYLRMAIGSYNCRSAVSTENMRLEFTITYHSTAAQETLLGKKIDEVLASLELNGKSEYEKARRIYNYIAANVKYASGKTDSDIFSAFGALVKGEAVCQGFAQLLYRMLREAGIDARIIEGKSNGVNHAWNIAKVDGSYYLMDVTWDSSFEGKAAFYFLKGSKDFDSFTVVQTHTTGTGDPNNSAIYPDYTSAEFNKNYPVSETAYDPEAFILGDVDGDKLITAADASIVLTAYAQASATGKTSLSSIQLKAADVNKNGKVDAVDASYILKYYALSAEYDDIDFADIPYIK